MRSSQPEAPLVAGVMPAAGSGTRLGGGVPKALRPVGGKPLLWWATRNLMAGGSLGSVVVVAPSAEVATVQGLLSDLNSVTVVPGGASRQESVRNGLAALPDSVKYVLVHDAARPFVPADVVQRVCEQLLQGADAVIPVIPVVDTIKRISGNAVLETVDRETLRSVQTPQGFSREILDRAHALTSGVGVTDDAGMVERLGGLVRAVAGSPEAFKVTGPLDLLIAEALAHRTAVAE